MSDNILIGNARERWKELGYDDPDRVDEHFRNDPWRLFYNGWIEGRINHVILIQKLVDVVARMAHYESLYRSGLSEQTVFENWQELASRWHELGPLSAAAGFKPTDNE